MVLCYYALEERHPPGERFDLFDYPDLPSSIERRGGDAAATAGSRGGATIVLLEVAEAVGDAH